MNRPVPLSDDVLLERVARAISATVDVDLHGGSVSDYSADDWRDFEPEARAALEAARYGEMVNQRSELAAALEEIAEASWPSVNGDDPVKRIQRLAKRTLLSSIGASHE